MNPIFHILSRSDWQQAVRRGVYEPASLAREGFIHCSTSAQIRQTADRWYRGQTDLLVLQIDVQRLTAELKLEPPANTTDERRDQLFPHLYGPLNLDAVTQVLELARLPAA